MPSHSNNDILLLNQAGNNRFSEAKHAAAATEGTLTKDLTRPEAEADPESACLR